MYNNTIIYHNTTRTTNVNEISNEISNFINSSINSLQRNSSQINNTQINNTPLSIKILNEETSVFVKNDNLDDLCPICNENYIADKICRKNANLIMDVGISTRIWILL